MGKLPIGISSFAKIREGDYVYVDKTALLVKLLEGNYFFLSRPRRFGKSLTVDTLYEMLTGNRELFRGLAAYDSWSWEKYPVINISFAVGGIKTSDELRLRLREILNDNARRLNVELPDSYSAVDLFGTLITQVSEKYQRHIAILVDEYDKPLLDNITSISGPAIRDELRDVYSVIKAHDAQLRFVFLTGVSKFSKVSIFSGLNNLLDITLDPRFTTLCGYTQHELETVFSRQLADVDIAQVKQWYNGYSWGGESVYNPFDILLFLEQGKIFQPYWFETGTPNFLLEVMRSHRHFLPGFEDYEATISQLNNFDIGHYNLDAILFQTGYLTVKSVDTMFGQPIYHLGFPNLRI